MSTMFCEHDDIFMFLHARLKDLISDFNFLKKYKIYKNKFVIYCKGILSLSIKGHAWPLTETKSCPGNFDQPVLATWPRTIRTGFTLLHGLKQLVFPNDIQACTEKFSQLSGLRNWPQWTTLKNLGRQGRTAARIVRWWKGRWGRELH